MLNKASMLPPYKEALRNNDYNYVIPRRTLCLNLYAVS
ncbi:hypothetical protein VCHA48P439_340034 [Vibrio chagasii]|nr:hypothetical protein VCHA48P439_340034 [Vibrio chagasii]